MTIADEIAKQLLSVQPMDPDVFKKLYECAKKEEDLIKEGYKPVSRFKLMWIK